MTLPSDQPVAEKDGSSLILQSTPRVPRISPRPARPLSTLGATPRAFRFSPAHTRAATTIATPETPIQLSSSSDHHSSHLETESQHAVPAPAPAPVTVKRDISSDDEDTKPPQPKRTCGWHPPLLAPSSDRSNRSRQRSILPASPRRIRSRSPRARAIYGDYKPGLRLASRVDQDATADDWYDAMIQATRNAHIARIERLRAREDVEEAIFEMDLFQLELAREKVEENQ
ncbi:uncharacterized protein KD926_011274 [Aspergillus affinis]|uniref:uncharacterized protein n=1 Tax=Aspergillus affinis TaxID=1070780 RepID=UPI0022FDEF7C|nr:uncharacterized protein KD926_011274 [Aspergillus affinis]KAI9038139.1 hypothetical protein KD926_011274 [Aspergillus affinis]